MKAILRENLDQNLARVESLIQIYELHPDVKGKGRKTAQVLDVLRAAVVLLHASLEDVLRGVAAWKLPTATAEVLNRIPFVGSGPNPRKLLLGDLCSQRGKSIDEIIDASVQGFLERSNYNNVAEISALLKDVGVTVSKVNGRFTRLEELTTRRHQIVHRADRKEKVSGSDDHRIRAINKSQVREWSADVRSFCNDLFGEL